MTREEAINQLQDAKDGYQEYLSAETIDMAIKALEQEPKTGHWIFQKITHGKRMWCSNCDASFDLCCNQIREYDEVTKKDYIWGYCPWCGAKMVESQESEDKE